MGLTLISLRVILDEDDPERDGVIRILGPKVLTPNKSPRGERPLKRLTIRPFSRVAKKVRPFAARASRFKRSAAFIISTDQDLRSPRDFRLKV